MKYSLAIFFFFLFQNQFVNVLSLDKTNLVSDKEMIVYEIDLMLKLKYSGNFVNQ